MENYAQMRILLLALDAASDRVNSKMKVFCVIGGTITIQHQGSSVYFDQGIPGLQQSNDGPLIENSDNASLSLSCIAWSRSRDIYRNNASQVTNQMFPEWLETHLLTTCLTRAELQKCEIVCQQILLCLDLYCATADCR